LGPEATDSVCLWKNVRCKQQHYVLLKKYDEQIIVGEELATSRSSVREVMAYLGIFAQSIHNSLLSEEAKAVEIGIGKCLSRPQRRFWAFWSAQLHECAE
jgi:hypothetical protein